MIGSPTAPVPAEEYFTPQKQGIVDLKIPTAKLGLPRGSHESNYATKEAKKTIFSPKCSTNGGIFS